MRSDPQEKSTVLPLHEERAVLTKQPVETAKVQVATVTRERQELLRETLQGEEAEVKRVAVDRVVTEIPSVRQEGNTTIIPLIEEVLFVEKRLVLREEIHIQKRPTSQTVEQKVTLRSEDIDVTRQESPQAEAGRATTPSPIAGAGTKIHTRE